MAAGPSGETLSGHVGRSESPLSATIGKETSPAIKVRGIKKQFGGTLALRGVDLDVQAGTIHSLIGENGAGKSTLLGVLAGRISPTAGDVSVFGQSHSFGEPRQARRLGIAAIYQELTIVPALSAVANVFLGQVVARGGILSERKMAARFRELSELLGVAVPAEMEARRLSVADQQMLEVMRGVQSAARILLFDEPTTALAPAEREALFRVMRDLRARGTTMILVSHNLDEVLEISDAVTVFRDGSVVATAPREAWSKRDLVRAMIGHDLSPAKERLHSQTGRRVLKIEAVNLPGALVNISLHVNAGEILGIGGLVGSGRSSLLRAIAGLEPHSHGHMEIDGMVTPWPTSPRQALKRGIAMVPEDRKTQGLVLSLSAMDNIALAALGKVARGGVLSQASMVSQTAPVAQDFGFSKTRLKSLCRTLSGGNQQKVLLAKWGFNPPKVLMVDEPTRGIDVGAKEEILVTLRRLAQQGMALIVVSSELEEVVVISDRVLVLSEGRLVKELTTEVKSIQVEMILQAAFKVERT